MLGLRDAGVWGLGWRDARSLGRLGCGVYQFRVGGNCGLGLKEFGGNSGASFRRLGFR